MISLELWNMHSAEPSSSQIFDTFECFLQGDRFSNRGEQVHRMNFDGAIGESEGIPTPILLRQKKFDVPFPQFVVYVGYSMRRWTRFLNPKSCSNLQKVGLTDRPKWSSEKSPFSKPRVKLFNFWIILKK